MMIRLITPTFSYHPFHTPSNAYYTQFVCNLIYLQLFLMN